MDNEVILEPETEPEVLELETVELETVELETAVPETVVVPETVEVVPDVVVPETVEVVPDVVVPDVVVPETVVPEVVVPEVVVPETVEVVTDVVVPETVEVVTDVVVPDVVVPETVEVVPDVVVPESKELVIYDTDTVSLSINKETNYFNVIVKENKIDGSETYNKTGVDEFLENFKNAWLTIEQEKLKVYLFVQIKGSEDFDSPLDSYIKLINCINSVNTIIKTHCHCMCILTNVQDGSSKLKTRFDYLKNSIKIIRPLLLTDKEREAELFLKTNKL